MINIYISGFSNQIDKNIDVQFSVLNKLGIEYFEPREIDEKNISLLTLAESKALKHKMDKAGIKASSIVSSIGKVDICHSDKQFELFKHVVEIAKILDTKFIRIYSFYNAYGSKDAVISALSELTAYAKKENITLLLENENNTYTGTPERCIEILDAVNSDNLKVSFDPASFVQCGEDTIKAFEMLKKHIAYINIKDSREDSTIVPAGAGKGNIKYILDSLKADGYNGFLSLKPDLGTINGEYTFTLAYNSLKILLAE